MFKYAMEKAAQAYGVALSPQQIASFARYNDLLLVWNEMMNLTAITDPEQVAVKHMIDSLSCCRADVFAQNATVIDVGTGAGFPGLPLKIWREDIQLTLLDALQKRVNFLNCVAEELKLENVCILHSRAEDGAKERAYREQFDVAVSRAVARLNVLCELCLPFVRPGGYFVALKGAQYAEEMAEAKKAAEILGGRIESAALVQLPGIDDVRAVIYIKKTGKTPLSYPRRAGIPEKNPL